ncbi:MAG: Wzz/FepE/Etk N-terminal domain-containing protein, partial [Phycisphaerae bacterium]
MAAPAPPTETPAVARRTHPPVLQVLRSRLGTIAAVMAFGMALGFLVMLQFTPVYKATAIIAVEQPGEGVSQREATLKSWALAEKVILKLNLTRDPEINTALTSRSFYRISTWFTAARQRDDIVVPPGTHTLTLKPPRLAAFAARLEEIPAGANTIRITFRSEDPAKAARIANAVAAQLPLEQPPAGTAAGPAAELAALAGQLRLSQDRLEQYRASLAVAAPAAAPAVDGRAEAELAAARRRLAALEVRQRKLADVLRRGAGLETVAGLSGVPGMDTLRRQQSAMA